MANKASITCSSTLPPSLPSSSLPSSSSSSETVSHESTDLIKPAVSLSPSQQQSPHLTTTSGPRKRVFSFQKRWLHSLPIIERTLSETERTGQLYQTSAKSHENAVNMGISMGSHATMTEKPKDVIVCMLCDDPCSKREHTKIWSRLNCRRGRIENHLMSKHPEFMRLLKHKREAEGDLAVQIFLQNLRDGRCNARTEINNGLYGQLTGLGVVYSNDMAVDQTELQKRALGEYATIREDMESHVKRTKMMECIPVNEKEAAEVAASVYSAGSMVTLRANGAPSAADAATVASVSNLTSSLLYQDALVSAHWQTIFFNKLVVVTGGDNLSMSIVATQLWLLGANVLLTFTTMSALDDFNTKHISRFPDPSVSDESSRGVMLPMLGSFRTQSDISEWCSSIATKYQRVNYLINYVGSEMIDSLSSEDANDKSSELIVSSVYEQMLVFGPSGSILMGMRFVWPCNNDRAFIEAINESMVSTCFSDRATGENGWLTATSGTIVHVATSQDSAAIESLVKASAVKLKPCNIQVNCVLLPSRQSSDTVDVEASDETATLSHSLLFFLSPSSRLLSGSVLRLEQDTMLAQALAETDRRTDTTPPPSATAIADVSTNVESI